MILLSCEDKPSPQAIITVTLNENIARFDAEVTGGDTYEWNFGDGTEISTLQDPEHIYRNFGQEYIVTLKISGPGGVSEFKHTVSIAKANPMQSLTGGAGRTEGKIWRLKEGEPVKVVKPDNSMELIAEWPGTTLTLIGYTGIYQNEFHFFNNGRYCIRLMTEGIPAGLPYCHSKGLQNHPPTCEAEGKGLTLITESSLPGDLSFGLNESKDLILNITYDGNHPATISFSDVSTITFSVGAFLGIYDFNTECLITQLTETDMTIALFLSDIPAGNTMTGKINKALLMKLVAED